MRLDKSRPIRIKRASNMILIAMAFLAAAADKHHCRTRQCKNKLFHTSLEIFHKDSSPPGKIQKNLKGSVGEGSPPLLPDEMTKKY